MRILIAVHTYPPGGVGGAEQRAERTARALQRFGHDVRVLSVHWSADRAAPEVTDESYQQIPVRRVWLAGAPQSLSESYDNGTVANAASALVAEWRPDVIHQYSGYLTSAAITRVGATAQVPVIVSLTDYWWFCSRITLVRTTGRPCDGPTPAMCALCQAQEKRRVRWPSLIAPRAAEAIWRLADRARPLRAVAGIDAQRRRATVLREQLASAHTLVAPSRFVADAYRRHGFGSTRLAVMRQGVENAVPVERRQGAGISIGYLGQIKPHKGVDLLIDAWDRLRRRADDRLVLVGPSPGEQQYRHDLELRTRSWKNVEWREAVSRDEIWRVLADLDVLVVPSRWAENSPNTILEAQAVQVPVVGARIGGIPELIEHRVNGLLFEPNDSADLAAQLQTLIDSPDLADQLRRGSIAVRTIDEEAREIVRVYEQALGVSHVPS